MRLENTLTRNANRTTVKAPAAGALPRLFQGERTLVLVGLLGPVLSAILTIVYFVHGPVIGKEGVLLKPIEFDLALGLFILNTAAVMPLAGFSGRGRAAMRWTAATLALYAYAVETVQILRGFDPRFSRQFHSFAEALPNTLFGLVSIMIVVYYVYLMYRFFRVNRTSGRSVLTLGVRYGMLSAMVAFAAGIWMIMNQGRGTGVAGNILSIHFIGFEGFKALLLTGWLAERATLAEGLSRRWVHVGGLTWLGACGLVCVQTALGRSVLSLSPLMLPCVICLGVWALATWRLLKSGTRRPESGAGQSA